MYSADTSAINVLDSKLWADHIMIAATALYFSSGANGTSYSIFITTTDIATNMRTHPRHEATIFDTDTSGLVNVKAIELEHQVI